MEFTKKQAAIHAGSTTLEAEGPSAGEIDLYDELITFAGLSPEEQLRLLARAKSVEEAVEPPSSDPLSSENSGSSVEIEATELPAETISERDDSVAKGEINEVRSKASKGSSVSGSLAPRSLAAPQPPSGSKVSAAKKSDVGPPLYDRSRTGPLLAGLNVIPEFVFAGDLSLGACLACGAESGADDLFCVSCGLFIDDIGSTPPKSNPTCGECGQNVADDEIFCPWCGEAPA